MKSTHFFVRRSLFCNVSTTYSVTGILNSNLNVSFFLILMHLLIIGGNMKTREELPDCPVATTVQLVGSKWKLLILRNLMARPWRFNELKKDLEGISQKVLTESLRSMEEDGIITRTVYAEVPPRVEYALSKVGESMRPVINAMAEWGSLYKEQTGE